MYPGDSRRGQVTLLVCLLLLTACGKGGNDAAASATAFCNLEQGLSISGVVQAEGLVEPSGLAYSRIQPHVLWVNNDSGNATRLFALGTDGSALGTVDIPVAMRDWEDLAMAPVGGGSGDYLYLADIGDNFAQQSPDLERDNIVVYRIPEPDTSALTPPFSLVLAADSIESMTLRYPDGKAHNAETLLVDPANQDLYIVTKETDLFSTIYNSPSEVYRAPSRFGTQEEYTLEKVAEIDFDALNQASSAAREYAGNYDRHHALPTAGDITNDRTHIGITTYGALWIWPVAEGQSIASALTMQPCEAPIALTPQLESFAFGVALQSYTLLNESLAIDANLYSY